MNGTQRIATKVGASNMAGCVDTTNVGAERLANARAYMQTLFAQEIELQPDTTATFVTNAGNNYDELQWQCVDDDMAWNITLQCDSDILLPLLQNDSTLMDTIALGIYYYHTDLNGEYVVPYLHNGIYFPLRLNNETE